MIMIENFNRFKCVTVSLFIFQNQFNMNLTPDSHFVLFYDILFEQTTCSPVMLVVNQVKPNILLCCHLSKNTQVSAEKLTFLQKYVPQKGKRGWTKQSQLVSHRIIYGRDQMFNNNFENVQHRRFCSINVHKKGYELL